MTGLVRILSRIFSSPVQDQLDEESFRILSGLNKSYRTKSRNLTDVKVAGTFAVGYGRTIDFKISLRFCMASY